jgi:lipoprotein-anchoring transpeptidase ErfK/SrfK
MTLARPNCSRVFTLIIFSSAINLIQALGSTAWLEVELAEQKAFLFVDGALVDWTPISSGRTGFPTPTGVFKILEKDLNHFSLLYGRILLPGGQVLRGDATGFDPVPRGARFVPARMRYFMRFTDDYGLHAGPLPGYPASHGCIRLPLEKAKRFYSYLQVGDQIRIRGSAPQSRLVESRPAAGVTRR